MISLLSKIFIRDNKNYRDQSVRSAYGILCGAVGIVLNLLLCGAKFIASFMTGSVSIAADALNNLSDAGSSLVTMLGFKLAQQKPDPDHPFGHGRFEYISGFVVAMLILLMGFELGKESVTKIIEGSSVEFSIVSVIILGASIAVKLYMYIYNTSLGKKLDSPAMRATGADSFSDCISTGVVMLCTIGSRFTSFNLDGWCGLAVAVFILWSGIKTAKDTLDPLLGTPPDPEFVKQIESIVMSYDNVCGIHDLVVHNYGSGRIMISLHAEMPQDVNILVLHDTVDNIERHLSDELGCEAVIHMDPIAADDEVTIHLHTEISQRIKEIDNRITIHDFRMVVGHTHTNLIFDAVIPYGFGMTDTEIKERIGEIAKEMDEKYLTVIHIDRSYVKL